MTVGQLKKLLAGISDKTPVLVYQVGEEAYEKVNGSRVAKVKSSSLNNAFVQPHDLTDDGSGKTVLLIGMNPNVVAD